MKIIRPKRSFSFETLDDYSYFFFLAGPIRGGGDWQAKMCEILSDLTEGNCTIACPCRWSDNHKLQHHFVGELQSDEWQSQTHWEREMLELAGACENGLLLRSSIIFWLPEESKVNPHPGPEPYAMDTRGELGEWRARAAEHIPTLAIGAEEGFHGLKQIKKNYHAMLGNSFPFYNTMRETAGGALKIADMQY